MLHFLPSENHLRSDPVYNTVVTDTGLLDRYEIEKLMTNDSVDPYVSLQMTIHNDALSHINRQEQHVSYDYLDFESTYNQYSLLPHHHHVIGASHFCHINNVKHSMTRMFSKVLPQACLYRTIGKVIRDILIEKRNATTCDPDKKAKKVPCRTQFKVLKKLRSLLIVSLLGNYVHATASSRPVGVVRDRIIQLCKNEHFIYALTYHAEQVIEYALRDYVVYSILNDPALYRFMNLYMNFESFMVTTKKYTDQMRRYFAIHLSLEHSSLCNVLSNGVSIVQPPQSPDLLPDEEDYVFEPYHHDLSVIFLDKTTDHLDAKYHRPNNPFILFLLERKTTHIPDHRLLSKDHIKALEYIVDHTTMDNFFAVLVILLPSFGVNDPAVLKSIRVMLHLYEHTTISILRIEAAIDGIRATKKKPQATPGMYHSHPYMYSVLQTGCMIWGQRHKLSLVSCLPQHYLINQLNATQQLFGLNDGNNIPESRLHLSYCDVCDNMYSLLREVDPKHQDKIPSDTKLDVDENAFNMMCGYKDPVVDYDTFTMYCGNCKVITEPNGSKRACGEEPLSYCFILGNAIHFQPMKSVIMLCPQDHCGEPFVLSNDCAYTERGVCCSDCTLAIHSSPPEHEALRSKYERLIHCADNEVKCSHCMVNITTPKMLHVYPCDIVICRKHNVKQVRQRVQTLLKKVIDPNTTLICDRCTSTKLCEAHYNRMCCNDCKKCKHINEYRFNRKIKLCEEHEFHDYEAKEGVKEINRCIILMEIVSAFEEIRKEKHERQSNNASKYKRQVQNHRNAESRQRMRR